MLTLLAHGWQTCEVAASLELSPRTVYHQMERIRCKLGAQNTTHAVFLLLTGTTGAKRPIDCEW